MHVSNQSVKSNISHQASATMSLEDIYRSKIPSIRDDRVIPDTTDSAERDGSKEYPAHSPYMVNFIRQFAVSITQMNEETLGSDRYDADW